MMDIAAKSFMMAVNICDTYNKLNGIECRVATKPKIELNISLDIDDLLYAQGFCERTQKGFASAIHETPRLMKGIYMNFFYGGKFLMTCPFNPPMNSR
ncbi:MAG: hypothetical protein DU429_08720 [Candidatus Tokpelaia sp.]|nr:MAG: hypothetical protein DU430_09095 [Candidatus Tokpelaia sp.]KAA6205058.1 MAG: hypothetical protein DU429_08720 [Candidatus Tokpelaia sp.]